MKTKKFYLMIGTLIALILMLPGQLAFAQEGDISACSGESVTGIVVAANEETNQITIATEDGLCTVTLRSDYGHPIVDLLGDYFGDVSLEDLQNGIEAMSVCALYDEGSGSWSQAECGTEGAVPVNLTGDNGDGTFTALGPDGELITISVDDPELAARLSEGLAALLQDWDLDEDGNISDVGQDIADYHDDGIGFGVLVKLYAISQETGVPVEELVEAFTSGTGLGELFEIYGKPSKLGVGHIRQELGLAGNGNENGNGNGGNNGNANGNGNNNGNGNGNGNNNGNGNGNGNNNGNGNGNGNNNGNGNGNNGCNGNGNNKNCPDD